MLKLKLQYFGQFCEEPTHWKRPWCWERLKAWEEEDDRGWEGWMASGPQWTWFWANSRRWWRTGTSGILQSTWSQRIQTQISNWTKPMISDTEHLFIYLSMIICMPFFGGSLFNPFMISWSYCLSIKFTSSLYILDFKCLSDIWIEKSSSIPKIQSVHFSCSSNFISWLTDNFMRTHCIRHS